MALYLNLVVSFGNRNIKVRHQHLIWYVLNSNRSHIYILKYHEIHIHVHLFQKEC